SDLPLPERPPEEDDGQAGEALRQRDLPLTEDVQEVETERDLERDREFFRKAEARRDRHVTASRLVESFFDQHDRNVADDRIDAVALHALQPLLDDRLLTAELLAVFVAHERPPGLGERHELHLLLAQRAREDLEQFVVDCHRARIIAKCRPQWPYSTLQQEIAGQAPPPWRSPRRRHCAKRGSMRI